MEPPAIEGAVCGLGEGGPRILEAKCGHSGQPRLTVIATQRYRDPMLLTIYLAIVLAPCAAPLAPPAAGTARVFEASTEEDEAPSAAERTAAIARGVEFLLATQEDYVRDRGIGRLPDDELAAWQKREQDRLDGLQGGDEASEWPYEGVYRDGRQRGAIPSGYRVGGTAIVCEALLRSASEGATREEIEVAVNISLEFIL